MKLSDSILYMLTFFMVGMSVGLFLRDLQLENRSVETKKAYYNSSTAELTWSCNVTKYIVTGEK